MCIFSLFFSQGDLVTLMESPAVRAEVFIEGDDFDVSDQGEFVIVAAAGVTQKPTVNSKLQ